MKRWFLLFTLFVLLLCENVRAAERVTLGIILFPPNTRYDPVKKECTGHTINVVRHILNKHDISMEVVCGTAARIYKLLDLGTIDFTFNIKSTRAVTDRVVFVEPAFSIISLRMYSHKGQSTPGTVAAIKGFDYNGLRDSLTSEGYEFVDLPNTISAIQVFLREKSDHLMAYSGPMDYYLDHTEINLAPHISFQEMFSANSHIALNKKSDKLEMLNTLFSRYAHDNSLQIFTDIQLPE